MSATSITLKGSAMIKVGQVISYYSPSQYRVTKYSVELSHISLGEDKIIFASDLEMLRNKCQMQIENWDEKWKKREQKKLIEEEKIANIEEAKRRTDEARKAISELENILAFTLDINDAINWDSLKINRSFTEPDPMLNLQEKLDSIQKPVAPLIYNQLRKPEITDAEFKVNLSFIDRILPYRRKAKEIEMNMNYNNALERWQKKTDELNSYNEENIALYNRKLLEYNERIEIVRKEVALQSKMWAERKEKFYKDQEEYNIKIDKLKEKYFDLYPEAVEEYNEMVLSNSKYPEYFPQTFQLEYNSNNKILIVDYDLPSIDVIPKISEVKYVASKKALQEIKISESELSRMYDDALYKLSIRTIHELFEADVANALETVSFNGYVTGINRATGKNERKCILSLQVMKSEFLEINLNLIEPKICFKNLKGISASKLSSLTPVKPILSQSKSDKRIIEGYNVVDNLSESTNLAMMDWKDFEHLIRELFEKEFKDNGGEVKITRASHDGGVDAIAFDPDPIRGGKIVIQAKRYNNIVGLSAVRDLYGTVMNEGASKGILVTTSDFGPEAYEFVKNKPITLLNGSNLLYLLGKHGYQAKIDIREAKQKD